MATKVRISKKGSVSLKDALRGLLIASLTSALVLVQTSIDSGRLVFHWKEIIMAAIGGGVSYVLKNWLFEPAKVITTTDTNKQADNVEEKIKEAL